MAITFAAGAYVEVGTNTVLEITKGTIGVWFRRLGRPASFQAFMSKHSSSSSNEGFGTYLDPSAGANQDKMHMYIKTTSGGTVVDLMTAPQVVFDGNWHLFSANLQIANASQQDLYLDGANKVSGNAAFAYDLGGSPQPVRFGRDNDTFWTSFDGSLAHGFYYNEMLTDAEHGALARGVSPLAIRPHALLIYIPMTGPGFIMNSSRLSSAVPAPTTSGTLSQAIYGPIIEPENEGFLFGDMKFSAMASSVNARRPRFNAIRSARRR